MAKTDANAPVEGAAVEAPKRVRKPRDPNAPKQSRPAFLLATVKDGNGNIIENPTVEVISFSRNGNTTVMAFDKARKEGKQFAFINLNTD